MKRCSYCGAEYPDYLTVCAVDETPLDEPQTRTPLVKRVRFAAFSEYKIPTSLAVVSYLFFIPGALCFAFLGFFAMMLFFGGQETAGRLWPLLGLVGVWGIFWVCLSRGLRRGERRWRTCALVIIWMGFLATVAGIAHYLVVQTLPHFESPKAFWFLHAFSFVVQIWEYRVLTRLDVRDLFYEHNPEPA